MSSSQTGAATTSTLSIPPAAGEAANNTPEVSSLFFAVPLHYTDNFHVSIAAEPKPSSHHSSLEQQGSAVQAKLKIPKLLPLEDHPSPNYCGSNPLLTRTLLPTEAL